MSGKNPGSHSFPQVPKILSLATAFPLPIVIVGGGNLEKCVYTEDKSFYFPFFFEIIFQSSPLQSLHLKFSVSTAH